MNKMPQPKSSIIGKSSRRDFNTMAWAVLGTAAIGVVGMWALDLSQKSPSDAYPAIIAEQTTCLKWESERSGKVGSTDVCKLWADPKAFAALRESAMPKKPDVADDKTACLQWRVTREGALSSKRVCELWASPEAFAALMDNAKSVKP